MESQVSLPFFQFILPSEFNSAMACNLSKCSTTSHCVFSYIFIGLTQAVKNSTISLKECERRMVEFIQKHTTKGKNCLAGNSVHADKEFLKRYMPRFVEQLHYRIVDVSTIKELGRHWFPEEYSAAPKKHFQHRALQDIKDSITELAYYQKSMFKCLNLR